MNIKNIIHIFLLIVFSSCDGILQYASLEQNENYYISYNHRGDVYIYNTTNQEIKNVTQNISDSLYYAQISKFSSNGEELLFLYDIQIPGNDGFSKAEEDDIFSYNLVTKKTTRFTNNPYQEVFPVYSPDNNAILYQSNEAGQWDIFLMNKDGSNKVKITQNPGHYRYPQFSFDGKFIYYIETQGDNHDIFQNNNLGTNEINLTNTEFLRESAPAISPNNGEIYYYLNEISDANNSDDILFRQNLDSDVKKELWRCNYKYLIPILSPDSRHIACMISEGGWIYIILMDIDGKNPINLGKGHDAEFTYDGKYLIYLSYEGIHLYNIENQTYKMLFNQYIDGSNIEISNLKPI